MLSVEPLRMSVWRVSKALKTTYREKGETWGNRAQSLQSTLTIALGSLIFGARALHTSCTEPSSDQVAAMRVSKYWGENSRFRVGRHHPGRARLRAQTHLGLWNGGLWLASSFDDFVKGGHCRGSRGYTDEAKGS